MTLPTLTNRAENESARSLLAVLLREQQEVSTYVGEQLTVVDQFSQFHDATTYHATQARFESLIPLSQPAENEQYAFRVDLDLCSGCKACVTACHSLNGLDENETWRDVGLLVFDDSISSRAFQHITTACHHCVEPSCLLGCPTRAYEKDATTGIVQHLDDQCMGCQYCVLMCPYDVPKYNSEKGIVRKCDMCHQRLSANQAPACVQGCPNEAIRIELVSKQEIACRAEAQQFLPHSPDPNITQPTTRYVTQRSFATGRSVPANLGRPQIEHVPWSLVIMLVLTQLSVGMNAASWLGGMPVRVLAATTGLIGVHASLFHLGRPLLSVKAWQGWRTSWLSREAIALGMYVGLATMFAGVSVFVNANQRLTGLWLATCSVGGTSVLCSAMIYAATKRPLWQARTTIIRFALTTCVLGVASSNALAEPVSMLPLLVLAVGKLAFDFVTLGLPYRRVLACSSTAANRPADRISVFAAQVKLAVTIRGVAGGVAVAMLATAVLTHSSLPTLNIVILLLLVTGEIAERFLFFALASPQRMPGVMP